MVVWRKVNRLKRLLSNTKKTNTDWRDDLGLFRDPKLFPVIKKGWPQFDLAYDPVNTQQPTSFRIYRPPERPRVLVPRESAHYNEDNLHELYGKFQFEAKGIFRGKAELAEKEVFDTAHNLHLVGWLKIRCTSMLGHVQGDTYALSYFRRWLEEKHLSKDAGTIDWVRLWEMNTGLELPLHYQNLVCIKDRRKYKNRKVHIVAALEKTRIARYQEEAAGRRGQEQKKIDSNCLQNY